MIKDQILTCTRAHRQIKGAASFSMHLFCPPNAPLAAFLQARSSRGFQCACFLAPAASPTKQNTQYLPLLVVVVLYRSLSVLWPGESDEPEPARAEGIFAIHDHPRVLNLQKWGTCTRANM